MNKAIIRLKEIFSENRVTSFSDFRKLSPDGFKRLDASVYGWFSSFRQDVVRQLAETDGLNMCLGLKRHTEEFAVGAPMEMIVKKLSFFFTDRCHSHAEIFFSRKIKSSCAR